jgi:hypothetical protein
MTSPANSLWRIWSAKNRIPHRTWWGTSGSQETAAEEIMPAWARERLRDLIAMVQHTAPTVIAIALNIFR